MGVAASRAPGYDPTMYLAIGSLGTTELIIILVMVLIFFGVGRLPDVLGQMGKGVKAFKDGMTTPDDEKKRDMKEIDVTPAEELRQSSKDRTTSA